MSCPVRFNFILLLALSLVLGGCQTDKPAKEKNSKSATKKKDKKEYTVMAFHLETSSSLAGGHSIPVYRQNPVYLAVEAAPFLDNGSVTNAVVVDHLDGFAILLQFDRHGAFVLDTVTTANKNRRMAITASFPEQRWLAAPLIGQRNPSGMLTFTPDATREEAERIVRGLNNVAAELRKRSL